MESKTNFSRRLKQFDGLTRLTRPHILRQNIYATAKNAHATIVIGIVSMYLAKAGLPTGIFTAKLVKFGIFEAIGSDIFGLAVLLAF